MRESRAHSDMHCSMTHRTVHIFDAQAQSKQCSMYFALSCCMRCNTRKRTCEVPPINCPMLGGFSPCARPRALSLLSSVLVTSRVIACQCAPMHMVLIKAR